MLNYEEMRRDNPAFDQIIEEVRAFEEKAYDFDLEETEIFEGEKLEKVVNLIREAYLSSMKEAKEEYDSAVRRGYYLLPFEDMLKKFDEEFANA